MKRKLLFSVLAVVLCLVIAGAWDFISFRDYKNVALLNESATSWLKIYEEEAMAIVYTIEIHQTTETDEGGTSK